MQISKKLYKKLTQNTQRYEFLKYEATVEQWAQIANVDSVEEVDQLIDLFIDRTWDDEE